MIYAEKNITVTDPERGQTWAAFFSNDWNQQ